jgi:glycine cleavage system H protein
MKNDEYQISKEKGRGSFKKKTFVITVSKKLSNFDKEYALKHQQINTNIMNIPENLLYTKDHEWLRIDGDTGYVGITDFAQSELGDIVFIEIETLGETISKGEVFGTIEAVKTVSDMFMPVSGEILEVNPAIDKSPDLVNKDPYGQGWMIKIKISNQDETKSLLNSLKYKELI